MPESATGLVELFVILVGSATLAGLIVQRIGIPYTVLLVLIGLAAAVIGIGLQVDLPGDLILTVFLPGLVFESGYRLDIAELRRTSGAIALLAVPGVIITAAVVGVVLAMATGLPVELGFLVGAMLAATDPAAVIATIKRMRAPERLGTLIEAESLFNDGTAIVVFTVAVAALTTGLSVVDAGMSLIITVAVSAAIGVVAGLVVSRVAQLTDDHLVELSLTLVLAYGTYMLADAFHMSGIIATVVAAITFGVFARRGALTQRAREDVDTVWEFAAFLLTAVLFLLIGLVIDVAELAGAAVPILWGVAAVIVARAAIVYGMVGSVSRLGGRGAQQLPARWLHVVFASGMRGAVSVALALSLPLETPQRELLVEITFGITLLTLVVQGLALDPVVRRSLRGDMGYDGGVIPTQ